MSSKSITFIAPLVGPLLYSENAKSGSGGSERQVMLIAKGMIDKGVKVNLICAETIGDGNPVLPEAQITFVPFRYMGGSKIYWLIDGIKLLKVCKLLNSDYYVIRSGGYLISFWLYIGQLFLGMKIISSIQGDHDINPELKYDKNAKGENLLLRKIHQFTIKHSTRVFVQTQQQQFFLKKYQKRDSLIVPNIASSLWTNSEKKLAFDNFILWAGNTSLNKRLEVVFQLAELLPDINFVVGMNPGNRDRFELAEEFSKAHANFHFFGSVPPGEMETLFKNAGVLLNTSRIEGFPNTFLQAWSCGVPVFTAGIDPDKIIEKNKLGTVVPVNDFEIENVEKLAENLRQFFHNPEIRKSLSENCIRFVKENHSMDTIKEIIYNSLFKN